VKQHYCYQVIGSCHLKNRLQRILQKIAVTKNNKLPELHSFFLHGLRLLLLLKCALSFHPKNLAKFFSGIHKFANSQIIEIICYLHG
jgi:hypothetical protein